MRKIAVFTGTRAEYGLLYWIIKGIHDSTSSQLQLLVGGAHLSREFGYTVKTIEDDGFPIAERLDFLSAGDSALDIAKSLGAALIMGGEALERHKPDLLVVLGDRYEAFAIVQAALLVQIPVAHIHGGELTEGAIDDAIRHSITKMSQLHFPATERYRQRIIQLGEHPSRVFNYGAPGLDNITRLPLLSLAELTEEIEFQLTAHYFLVTYHPVTLALDHGQKAFTNLLNALEQFPDHQLVITYPNADEYGRQLIEQLKQFRNAHSNRIFLSHSMGQLRYLSAMKHCNAVIGNSSSGLIEAPSFGVPTVNIGNRQQGRLTADTVLMCDGSQQSIEKAIKIASSESFLKKCKIAKNPYGSGNVSHQIVQKLIEYPLDELHFKLFFDVTMADV